MSWLLTILWLGSWGEVQGARAGATPLNPCQQDKALACFERWAGLFSGEGAGRAAIELLKEGISRYPDSRSLHLWLARAYLSDANEFWALSTALRFLQAHPGDCEVSLWAAWISFRQGALEQARAHLAGARCEPGPLQTRAALYGALLSGQEGDRAAEESKLEAARGAREILPEDRALLQDALKTAGVGYVVPVSGKLELSSGWAANPRAGSPVDPISRGDDQDSPVVQLGGKVRALLPDPWLARVRPLVELSARGLAYTRGPGKDFSYLHLGGSGGALLQKLGGAAVDLALSYHFDALLLGGGDRYEPGPLWYQNAHRGEFELDLGRSLSVFGGAGKRIFRESRRSRLEVDAGAGGQLGPWASLSMLWALSARFQEADRSAYDLWGATAFLALELSLGARFSLRCQGLVAYDAFPRSRGFFDSASPESTRTDLWAKSSLGLGFSLFPGARATLAYELAGRFSEIDPYDYQDHRVLAGLEWNFRFDPWLPRSERPAGHVPMDYELRGEGFQQRVRELLEQDEAAQRGSSCVE